MFADKKSPVILMLFLMVLFVKYAHADESAIYSSPFLKDKLPANSMAYMRLPSLWGGLSAPSGSTFDDLVKHPQSVETIETVKTNLQKNIIGKLPADVRGSLELFTKHMRSPLA